MKNIVLFLSVLSLNLFAAGDVIDWSSPEGVKRLERSKHKVDFFALANHFESQKNKIFCGPTSATIVLNALRGGKDIAPVDTETFDESFRKNLPEGMDPLFHKYTQNTFFSDAASKLKTKAQVCGEKIDDKADFGLQLRQLQKMLVAHGLNADAHVVDDAATEVPIKKDLITNLAKAGDFVLVNYARKSLDQKGGGHISPLGAYDKASDSFLVMDVNPNTAPWVWVTSPALIKAMKTKDTVENRGYVLVSDPTPSK